MRRFLIAALLFTGVTGSAQAASWTAPARLSTGDGLAPSLSVGREGDAAVAWTEAGAAWVSTRVAGDVFQAPVRLGNGAGPAVAINGAGDGVVAWTGSDGGAYASLRSQRGTFGTPQLVSSPQRSPYVGSLYVAAAINTRGDVALAWLEPPLDWTTTNSFNVRRVMVAVRPSGAAFRPPQELARHDTTAGSPRVAVDDEGHITVAWQADHTWVANGEVERGFGAPEAAGGDPAARTREFSLAATPAGAVTLVATVGPFAPQNSSVPQGVYVTNKPPGGSFSPFRAVINAAGPPYFGAFAPRLATAPDGSAVIAWAGGSEWFNAKPIGGDWQPATQLPSASNPPFPRDGAVAIDAGDRAVFAVALERGYYDNLPITVIRRLPSGQLEPPTMLGAAGTRNLAPAIGFDDLGNGVLAWEGGDSDPGNRSGYDTSAPIKFSLYDGKAPTIVSFDLARRGRVFRMRVSEPARLEVSIRRRGHTVARLHARVRRGTRFVRIPRRVRIEMQRGSRYVATATARDSANRRSRTRRIRF